jgi:hypothetical protein
MSARRKGYYKNEEIEIISNLERVTCQRREKGTKENKISTPMPQKKGDISTRIKGY